MSFTAWRFKPAKTGEEFLEACRSGTREQVLKCGGKAYVHSEKARELLQKSAFDIAYTKTSSDLYEWLVEDVYASNDLISLGAIVGRSKNVDILKYAIRRLGEGEIEPDDFANALSSVRDPEQAEELVKLKIPLPPHQVEDLCHKVARTGNRRALEFLLENAGAKEMRISSMSKCLNVAIDNRRYDVIAYLVSKENALLQYYRPPTFSLGASANSEDVEFVTNLMKMAKKFEEETKLEVEKLATRKRKRKEEEEEEEE